MAIHLDRFPEMERRCHSAEKNSRKGGAAVERWLSVGRDDQPTSLCALRAAASWDLIPDYDTDLQSAQRSKEHLCVACNFAKAEVALQLPHGVLPRKLPNFEL